MSWLGRLFGGGGTPEPAPLPATAVVLPDDLAAALTAAGGPLEESTIAALRAHLEQASRKPARKRSAAESMPFWLARDQDDKDGDIEDRLRERVEQRRATEEGSKAAGD